MTRISLFAPAWAAVLIAACLAGCVTTTQQATTPAPATNDIKESPSTADEPDSLKRARARMDLASAYFSRGQMTTALDEVKRALAADPTYGPAYNLRGLIYANLGDNAGAEDSFKRALALNPADADTMNNYGYFLCERKRYPESTAYFNQALAVPQYRGAARTLFALGVCQAYAGQLAQSDASLTRSYELDPSNPATATNLAQVLYQRGEYERARFYIRRVNALPDVSNSQTLWLAARIEHKIGDDKGAALFGSQLRSRFPDSREASAYARGAFDE
jgi:type IV pilus assembly protein PilF